jgi:hypothetical protein
MIIESLQHSLDVHGFLNQSINIWTFTLNSLASESDRKDIHMRTFLLAALFACIPFLAEAVTLKYHAPVCQSKDLLDQLVHALQSQDNYALSYLRTHGCGPAKAAYAVTVLSSASGAAGTEYRVRLYDHGDAIEMWAGELGLNGLNGRSVTP